MKYFHIFCDGGFGNRLSCLIGGLTLARLAGFSSLVSWPNSNFCGALFEDIFKTPFYDVSSKRISTYYPDADRYTFLSCGGHHMDLFQKARIEPSSLNLQTYLQFAESSAKPIFYYSPLLYDWIPAAETDHTIRKVIRFNDHIMTQVNNFIQKNFGEEEYYGVHLRMTDFLNIESFDVDYWINTVRNSADKKFFICSDDPQTEARFNQLPNAFSYPKIHKTEKLIEEGRWRYNYVDEDGRPSTFNVNRGKEHVIEAVIDFLLLANSQAYQTGKHSIFLKMARRFGDGLKGRNSEEINRTFGKKYLSSLFGGQQFINRIMKTLFSKKQIREIPWWKK
jgi:hypothetical protein